MGRKNGFHDSFSYGNHHSRHGPYNQYGGVYDDGCSFRTCLPGVCSFCGGGFGSDGCSFRNRLHGDGSFYGDGCIENHCQSH